MDSCTHDFQGDIQGMQDRVKATSQQVCLANPCERMHLLAAPGDRATAGVLHGMRMHPFCASNPCIAADVLRTVHVH